MIALPRFLVVRVIKFFDADYLKKLMADQLTDLSVCPKFPAWLRKGSKFVVMAFLLFFIFTEKKFVFLLFQSQDLLKS